MWRKRRPWGGAKRQAKSTLLERIDSGEGLSKNASAFFASRYSLARCIGNAAQASRAGGSADRARQPTVRSAQVVGIDGQQLPIVHHGHDFHMLIAMAIDDSIGS